MLAALNSGWALALVVAVFGTAYARRATREFRQGKMLQALATSLWAVGWAFAASLGFLGLAVEHSAHTAHYARALRLLSVMRVCGVAGGCLTVVGTALTIYCGSQTRTSRRKGRALETDPASGPDAAWPPPPNRPSA